MSELINHYLLDILKNCLHWLPKVVFIEFEPVPHAMVLEHAVEGPESHPWSVIPSCEGDVVVPGKIRRKRETASLLFVEHVVNDLQCLFVGVNVIECEDCSDFLSPIVVCFGERLPPESLLDPFSYKMGIFPLDVEAKLRMFSHELGGPVENGVKFVCCDVVGDSHFVNDVSYLERSCEEENSSFLTVLVQVGTDRTVTHEHQISIEQFLLEGLVHLISLDGFQVSSSVRQQGERNSCCLEGQNRVSGSGDGGGSTNQNSVNICDKEWLEGSLLFDDVANVGDDPFHLNKYNQLSDRIGKIL